MLVLSDVVFMKMRSGESRKRETKDEDESFRERGGRKKVKAWDEKRGRQEGFEEEGEMW